MPVDLTLEQTINVDAANQRTGIKWAESHYRRLSIISHLFEKLNLTPPKNGQRHLKSNRIKKIRGAFGDVNFNILTLFNIGSGKAANKEATSFLLYVTDIRNRAREEFIKQCKSNQRRFEERIKKQKIHSFAKEGTIVKLTNKN